MEYYVMKRWPFPGGQWEPAAKGHNHTGLSDFHASLTTDREAALQLVFEAWRDERDAIVYARPETSPGYDRPAYQLYIVSSPDWQRVKISDLIWPEEA